MTTTCRTCVTPIGYIDSPTGGWWAHEQHPADEHDAVPAAWADGDPLMEAIAETVWAHCRSEGTVVADDPRNIAATAAAVARHSAAVPVPPPAGTDLRAQLLDALDFAYCQGLGYDTPEALLAAYDASRGVPVPPPADQTATGSGRAAEAELYVLLRKAGEPRDEAQALIDRHRAEVLAVLPEQTDRAAVFAEAIAALDKGLERFFKDWPDERKNSPWVLGWKDATTELRRVAAEEQPTETHSCRNCEGADPDTCLTNPDRPKRTPMDPVHILGIYAEPEQPAVGEQPETKEAPPATLHAIPLPGSNGISACCGRPPCEFVGERVTRNPDEVTCRGPE
jgi:hypothetical protein